MTTEPSTTEDSSSEEVKFDLIGRLPVEIAQKILFQLSPNDLHSATSCCSSWRAMVAIDYIWERLCQCEAYFEVEEWKRSEYYNSFFKRYNYWQAVYWYNHIVNKNWESNNYRTITYKLKGLQEYKYRYVFDGVFARESLDHKILYVHNLKNKALKPFVFSMREHEDDHGGQIITQNGKYLIHFIPRKSITVWDIEKGLTVLDQLWKRINDVHFYKNLMVLETWRQNFEVYNLETKKIEYRSTELIKNVDIMDGRIVFTSEDHVIHILKWADKSTVTLTCCDVRYEQKLLVKNEFLLSLCLKKDDLQMTLCVWNITTKTKLHTLLTRHLSTYLRAAYFMNNYLWYKIYPGNDDDDHYNCNYYVDLWDYKKGTLVGTFVSGVNKHTSSDSKISNDHFIIAANLIKLNLWCLKTKNFVCELDHSTDSSRQDDENVLITHSNLLYVVEQLPCDIYLYVRDYEV